MKTHFRNFGEGKLSKEGSYIGVPLNVILGMSLKEFIPPNSDNINEVVQLMVLLQDDKEYIAQSLDKNKVVITYADFGTITVRDSLWDVLRDFSTDYKTCFKSCRTFDEKVTHMNNCLKFAHAENTFMDVKLLHAMGYNRTARALSHINK